VKSLPKTIAPSVRTPWGLCGGDEAFSLVELLISVAIMGFVMAVVLLLINGMSGMADRLDAQAQTTDESRRAVDVMTRELRMAQGWGDTAPVASWAWPVYYPNAQDNKLSIWADIDKDGGRELVTYKTSGTGLVRTVTEASGGVLGTEGPARSLITSLTGSAPIFTYYDQYGAQLVTGGGTQSLDLATEVPKVVTVRLQITAAATGRYAASGQTSTVNTLVRLRSVETSAGF
jgi:prepilin-type N-terminal cleavage/methylation domain-containing protein